MEKRVGVSAKYIPKKMHSGQNTMAKNYGWGKMQWRKRRGSRKREEDLGVVEWLSNLDGNRWETDGHLDEGGTRNLPWDDDRSRKTLKEPEISSCFKKFLS